MDSKMHLHELVAEIEKLDLLEMRSFLWVIVRNMRSRAENEPDEEMSYRIRCAATDIEIANNTLDRHGYLPRTAM